MRADIQQIFIKTSHISKSWSSVQQCPNNWRKVSYFTIKDCKKFCQSEVDIFIDYGKLILHELAQFFVYIQEIHINSIKNKKFEKLTHLLDSLAFNKTIIVVNISWQS